MFISTSGYYYLTGNIENVPVKVTVTWPNGETEERTVMSQNETVTIGTK